MRQLFLVKRESYVKWPLRKPIDFLLKNVRVVVCEFLYSIYSDIGQLVVTIIPRYLHVFLFAIPQSRVGGRGLECVMAPIKIFSTLYSIFVQTSKYKKY